ncbi:MAG: MerR family transcriptional regulator [Candidatus Doudnabacteria bacterium]|nr:MerR family transcriptional regulator [Candidatus Doudnabacteria bacterium]
MKLEELLTLKQVTHLLSVHPNTLRNWEKEGLIDVVRIGPRGDRRYKKQSIQEILKGSFANSKIKEQNAK